MRPLDDGFSTGNEPVLGTIDITRGAFCVVRDTSLSFSCGRSLRKCAAANVEVLGRVKECSRRGIPICWYLGVHRSAGHWLQLRAWWPHLGISQQLLRGFCVWILAIVTWAIALTRACSASIMEGHRTKAADSLEPLLEQRCQPFCDCHLCGTLSTIIQQQVIVQFCALVGIPVTGVMAPSRHLPAIIAWLLRLNSGRYHLSNCLDMGLLILYPGRPYRKGCWLIGTVFSTEMPAILRLSNPDLRYYYIYIYNDIWLCIYILLYIEYIYIYIFV